MKGQILKGERPGVGFGPEACRMGVRVGWRGVSFVGLWILGGLKGSMGGLEGESVERRRWFWREDASASLARASKKKLDTPFSTTSLKCPAYFWRRETGGWS
jgi:hypothetical protein